jgi:CRISPR-associated endoribonuclease Cas6
MRLMLRLSPNTEPVPYDHLHRLTGTLHKWLGENDLHDGTSLYSFGWLQGAVPQNGHLRFPRGASWAISFHDPDAARALLKGLLRQPPVFAGMHVVEVQECPEPAFGEQMRFYVDGPVVAREFRADGTRAYLLYDNPAADAALTRVLRTKLAEAGFSAAHQQATLAFDRAYPKARTKLATVKGTKHKASECPVFVTGTPEAVRFAWLVGAGDLTGCGFGALR